MSYRGGVGWVMKGWGRVVWVGHKGWSGVGWVVHEGVGCSGVGWGVSCRVGWGGWVMKGWGGVGQNSDSKNDNS